MPQGSSAVRPTNGFYLLPFYVTISFYKIDYIPWGKSEISI